jgi:hypothetical protein
MYSKEKPLCKNCGESVKRRPNIYCSQKCQLVHYADSLVEKLFSTNTATDSNRKTIKKYLIRKRGHCCEICKNTEWLGQPIPLVLDHIDGASDNNLEENLRLVCGNCDMQLPTYKNKNKGKGREYRRKVSLSG